MRCPGQDTRTWKPEDIFEWPCPACGAAVEFFKDDSSRRCSSCGLRVSNPRLDLGCAEWCPYGEKCLREAGADPPRREDLDAEPPSREGG